MIGQSTKLGEELISQGVITEEQLAKALNSQENRGGRLGNTLVQMGLISPSTLVHALANRLRVSGCVLRHGLIDPKVARVIPREEAERLKVLPMFKVRETLAVAMAEPQSLPVIDRLKQLTGCNIRPILALEENIKEFSKKYLAAEVTVDAFLATIEESDVKITENEAIDEGPITDLDQMVDGSPIVNLVNLAILTALRDGASDIHIEPERKSTRIRYRIDGTLRELMSPPSSMHAAIISRIKVIGRMDIAEKRLPQEGRVHISADKKEIDLRVSSMPTILGEKIVLRVLDKTNLSFELDDLGLQGQGREHFEHWLTAPHGLVLVTGPTGSGKTTTLYSALDLLRSEERNIVTVEDPVEYQLDLINQIQVNERVGLTFSRALRSILRQDPDVIMVGEIRDGDTAQVAVQAALTGHLVLSTLHTNDTPGTIVRLIDMGVEPYLIPSCILGVIAQRLTRKICPSCKTSHYLPQPLLDEVGWSDRSTQLFQKGEGCKRCHNTGFRGRVGIYEVMPMSATIKKMLHEGKPTEAKIREHLSTTDWRSLRTEGLRLVESGECVLQEVLRVTREELVTEPSSGSDTT